VYVLESLNKTNLIQLLEQAITKDEMLKTKRIDLKETDALLRLSGGDGRKLLNVFELVINTQNTKDISITNEIVMASAQENVALYDKTGEQHYDIISAFIKSIRGSDPNAAVYWLARMLEGGEDIKFIARRMIILASEDIGNANPTALVMANNCFQSINVIGMPEARIILSQTAIYLASSAKSNASYMAINIAQESVREQGALSVPLELRNAPTKLMKDLNYGKEYDYAHNYENNFINQEYMPDEIKGHTFYEPGNNDRERQIRKFLKERWNDKYNY
jgi:putative ATPase